MGTMTEQTLRDLIARGETLTVEFKSDHGPLPDTHSIEAVVCLANGQGGTLLIGVAEFVNLPEGLVSHPRRLLPRTPSWPTCGRMNALPAAK